MRKKYVSLMLIFTILFSTFMPALTALATEAPIVINEIRITSETTSVTAGVLPEFSASTTTDGLSIEGYGSNTGWVMRGASTWFGFGTETPTASADGTHYGLRLSLQTTGYTISGSSTIYFNGTDITHQENTELDTEYGYLYIDLGEASEATTNTVINPINVTGFTAPVANAQANVSSIGLSEGLTITNTSDKHAYWLLADSPFTELASTDTFEAGTSYILYIPYTVNSGYEVADPESVAIGGTAVTSANKGYCAAGEIRLIYTATAASAPVTESSGFTVTFDVGEYSTTVVPSQNWSEPHLVVAPDVTPESETHNFVYWYKDDANTPYEFGETLESENMTLHAHWTEKSTVTPPGPTMWTVNFDIGESKTVIPNQNVANGLYATIPDETPILDGWTFVRWCEDSTRNTAFDFEHVAIEKNTTVYAKYVKNVTVTIDVKGGNPLTKTKCTGTAGQTLADILGELMSITPSHPDGKVLIGLNDVDGDGNETPLDMSGIEDMEVTEDMTLKFVWGDAITSLDFTVTPPTAGTTTTTPKDEYNDYIWDEQTNKPVVAIPTGVHYALNGDPYAYWVSGYEEAQIVNPFIGTFEAGNRYNIHAFLTIDDGYAMAEDCTITLNGEETEKIIIAEGLDPETGAHILEVGLNVEIPSNEVTVTIDPNGGNELDRPYYHGTKGKSLSVIIAEFYNGDEPTYPNGDKRFWGFEDESGNPIFDIDNITENLTIYCSWRDAIKEVNITLTSPLAGTTTTTDKDGTDWDYESQTNPPEVSVPSGVNYELDTEGGKYLPAYWVEGFDYPDDPFIGTFVQGQTYKAEIYLNALNDYVFAKDVKVKINGEETGVVLEDDGGWLVVGGNIEVLPTYKVTFHPNGGSVSPTTKEYQEGAKLGTLPVPTRSGWGFTGWYNWFWKLVYENPFRDSYYGRNVLRLAPGSSPTGSGIFGVGQTLVFDVTINNTIPVSIDVADRDVAVGNGYTIDGNRVYGQIELTASLLGSGYSFLDINCADGVTSYVINDFKLFPAGVSPDPITSDTVMGASDMTVMAAWTPGASTVSFDTDGGSEIAPQAVKTGAYATRPTEKPVKDGYKFEDWYVDSDFSARFNFSTAINGDTVVYARYIKLIKEVNITAELPKLGETITKEDSMQVPQLVLTVDGEGYRMPETETGLMMYWLDPAGEGLADGLEIEPETGYQVVLFALANKGYAFADDVVVKINGVATTVFDMGEANEGMEILATITTDSLKIIGGKDQTHIKGTSDGLTITCNGGFRQFRGLRVGTTELDASAFDSKAGSTIVTLKPDYLNSLELGTYQISFLYQGDRECSTNFTIAKANEPAQGGGGGGQAPAPAATNSPVTGDTITVWILIMTMSGLAMIGIIYNLRRKNR